MSEAPTTDVVVIGAGPAGTCAAITLARLGRSVTVIDKAKFPRDKCCGDGLTTGALRQVEALGLDPSTLPSWEPVDGAIVVSTDGRATELPLPATGQFAASVRRAEFDSALVDLAAKNGVSVLEGRGLGAIAATAGATAVDVTLDDGGGLRARYAIAADGMWSATRKLVGSGAPGYLGGWQAGRQYFVDVGPLARQLWVWFEPDMVPGYAWSFPLADGTANVGYGVVRRPGEPLGELKGQRIDFLARPHIAEVLGPKARAAAPWKAWPIPTSIGTAPLSGLGGRVLFVGDAARACDPMTGEGIAQAFETAELAARALVAAGPDRPDRAETRYRRQIRWGMAVDDRLGRDLSRVLARPRGSAKALAIVDHGEWARRQFARWMFEDYPRAAFVTPHRWSRGILGRPGAFAGR